MAGVQPREDRAALGLAIYAMAVLGFTCIDTSAKWLIAVAALPPLQVVFARYAGHFILAMAIYTPTEGPQAYRSQKPVLQLLRSLFLLGSTVFNFMALQYLPLTLTTTIMFSGPIVITLLAIPLLGEKVGLRRLIAVCFGFIGVVIVVQPWGAAFNPAVFLSLGALCMASMYFIMTRMLAGVESNATSQIWASGIATLCLAPFAAPLWIWPETTTGFVVLALIGVFGGLSHIAATYAHRLADASILAPMIYTQIFTIAVASYLVFGAWPTIWTLAGGAVIIGSGLYIWSRERARSSAGETVLADRPGAWFWRRFGR